MLGLFGTLDLAKRSLQTQMVGVEVTGQNLANVNTAGYSRQTVQIATSPDITTAIGSEGTGANAVSIQQMVSNLLNGQIQSQNSISSYWTSQQTAFQSAQNGLDEFLNGSGATSSTTTATTSTSATGLSSQLTALFNAFSSLAAAPSISTEQAAVGAAQSLSTTFNQISSQFSSLDTGLNSSLSSDVSSANQLLTQIADLNSQITKAQFGGGNANNLLDQREQALESLSKLTTISTSTGANGEVNVSIGGQTLVSGGTVNDTLQTYDPGNGNLLVQTATGGVNLTLTGGSMQGTIDARDGELATMQNQLNSLASNLITSVNSLYSAGYSTSGTTGASFFTGTNAADISVASSLVNDPTSFQLAASATATGDNTVALQLAQLANTAQTGLNNQTFGSYYGSMVAGLGNSLSNANTQVTNQSAVSSMLTTQRSSISGVNTDEEMTNLMAFQRAYEASAKLVSTIDTLLGDTLAMKT